MKLKSLLKKIIIKGTIFKETVLHNESFDINLAFERINKLPKGSIFDDAKRIDGVFNRSKHSWTEVVETFEKNQQLAKATLVNVKDIQITQPNVRSNTIEKMILDFDKLQPINVVQFPDGLAIYDGHHRLVASWAIGEIKIKVNLLKV